MDQLINGWEITGGEWGIIGGVLFAAAILGVALYYHHKYFGLHR